jgi:aspartate-semialdehyde dehydrogenase
MSEAKTSEHLKRRVGILGATGLVGQRFIALLESHPWFDVVAVAASEKSAGKTYGVAVNWKLTTALPSRVKDLPVTQCTPEEFKPAQVDIVFSALDASVAGEIEEQFAAAGYPVFSNAKNHRYDADVPILIPHVNASHLDIVPHQRKTRGYPAKGCIVTNANCSSTGLVIALKPLLDAFGLAKLFVVTMQAISGAGYPGVSAMDIYDNVVPYIGGEEPKLQKEPAKILGKLDAEAKSFIPEEFPVSAHCNRVPVIDGHTECVSVQFCKPATVEQVIQVLRDYRSEAQTLKLPSAPEAPIYVFDEKVNPEDFNRPQPRLDRDLGGGYVVTVGRVRECPLLGFKFVLLSHNTVIGAAGGSIQNAELAVAKGLA